MVETFLKLLYLQSDFSKALFGSAIKVVYVFHILFSASSMLCQEQSALPWFPGYSSKLLLAVWILILVLTLTEGIDQNVLRQ